jgi:hypothetical protein
MPPDYRFGIVDPLLPSHNFLCSPYSRGVKPKLSEIPPSERISPRAGDLRHFRLLWDEDLEDMQEIFKAIRDRRAEVVAPLIPTLHPPFW